MVCIRRNWYVVSIHAPTGGATIALDSHFCGRCFNPRPHGGGDASAGTMPAWLKSFNPRPHGGGDGLSVSSSLCPHSFNPRPHGGGDWIWPGRVRLKSVSIHAPTGGATSTPPPSRGRQSCFNPRPHGGGDSDRRAMGRALGGFNPRPHGGGDLSPLSATTRSTSFQSTPPRGGRPGCSDRRLGPWCFNPRPHGGGDVFSPGTLHAQISFQSTPPRGGRPATVYNSASTAEVSIHAPTGGATAGILTLGPRNSHKQLSANLSEIYEPASRAMLHRFRIHLSKSNLSLSASLPAKPPAIEVRGGFQTMRGPCGSYVGLAPACSTLRCQFLPRK